MDLASDDILALLARGEREAARTAIRATPPGSRLLEALRITMIPPESEPAAPGGPPTRSPLIEPPTPPGADANVRERAAWSLECGLVAARALSEGRVDELVRQARAATAAAPDAWPWIGLRAASLMQAAFRFTGSAELFREAVESCERVGNRTEVPHLAVVARALLASLYMMSGRLHAAMDRCAAALDLARATGLEDDGAAALAHQFRGYVLYEWNRLTEAEAELKVAWDLAGPEGRGVRSGVARVLATIYAARGRTADSDLWMGRLTEIVAEPMTLRNREWLAAVRIQQAVLVSRAPDATPGERRAGLREVEEWRRGWEYEPMAVEGWDDAHVRSRLHELDHAMTLLEITHQWPIALALADRVVAATTAERAGYLLKAQTVRAVALLNLGRPAAAMAAWDSALELGEGGGFVRSFLDGSESRVRLLRMAVADPSVASRAARVTASVAGWIGDTGAPALTHRQQQVLVGIARGLSNQAIADEMELGLATVKSHVREVLRRLEVPSRTAAIARGRELGLVQPTRFVTSGLDQPPAPERPE